MDINFPEKLLLGNDAAEVKAVMYEEGCANCFGCPLATVEAAEMATHSRLSLELMNISVQSAEDPANSQLCAMDRDFIDDLDERIGDRRQELKRLTADCPGYIADSLDTTAQNACQSPN